MSAPNITHLHGVGPDLLSLLAVSAEIRPDHPLWISRRETLTYRQAVSASAHTAAALRALGIRTGDCVALLIPNGVDFCVALYGVLGAGATVQPLDIQSPPRTLQHLLGLSRARALMVHPSLVDRLDTILGTLPALQWVIPTGIDPDLRAGGSESDRKVTPVPAGISMPFTLNEGRQADRVQEFDLPLLPDIAMLLPTTGTTGLPKCVALSHEALTAITRQISLLARVGPEDVEVTALPLTRGFGMAHLFCYASAGATVAMEENLYFPHRTLQWIHQLQATSFPCVPTTVSILLERFSPLVSRYGQSLRYIMLCSARLKPDLAEQVLTILPGVDLIQTYGLTEAIRSTGVRFSTLPRDRWESVGRALQGVEVTIRDPEGAEVPAGGEGEIVIRGAHLMRGYLLPDGTLDRDGGGETGFLTGDLGHLDADGLLYLTGRLKDIINVAGRKLHPAEVEDVLREWPAVADCGVVGVPDPEGRTQESVVACVVLRAAGAQTSPLDTAALHRFLATRMESFKVPRWIVPLDDIPRGPSAKILRYKLAEAFQTWYAGRQTPESTASHPSS